jgi:putative membrane protein
MSDGFLGYKTSFMLDFVVCALTVIVPALIYSIYLVKFAKRYTAHRNIQLVLAVVLLIAVGAFEIDMQMVQGGWKNVVDKRVVKLTAEQITSVQKVLWVHLVFAVTSPILWGVTITLALKRIPKPPGPCAHSPLHKKLGWASTIDLALTSVTGVWFYYVAFVR